MVGEIRDRETAEMAVQAALTGHLVLSTLHTNDAPSAVTRLLDIGVEPYLLASTVLGVLAQRLVRTFCTHCREPSELDASTWTWLTQPWQAPQPKQTYAAHGCLECRMTGYHGRVGLYELMTMTDAQRKVIQSGADPVALREQALRDGMRPLRLSGALKVAAGQSSVEEVLKAVPQPPERRS
jgi:general secretion pathway protein E